MSLEIAFQELSVQLRKLRETFVGVRLTVVEDKPLRDEVALVDTFGNVIEDVMGWIEEAVSAAAEGQQAVGNPLDAYRARQALTISQERFNRLALQFAADLICYERILELKKFGRRRGGEWLRWTNMVKQALDQCRQPLQEVNEALFMCWQELTERLGTTSISLQNTTIGQQISMPEVLQRKAAQEGVT